MSDGPLPPCACADVTSIVGAMEGGGGGRVWGEKLQEARFVQIKRAAIYTIVVASLSLVSTSLLRPSLSNSLSPTPLRTPHANYSEL